MNILFLLHVLLDVFFIICLVWCFRTDKEIREIPNKAILLILILSVAQFVLVILNEQPFIGYVATLFMFIPMYLWWRRDKMGGGDLKLFLVCGLYLGLLYFMGALLVTILLVVISRKALKKKVPLAVYFAPGGIAMIVLQYALMFT
jgi:Flp pilus assembly protein protease CpaA